MRRSKKELSQFLTIALGSHAEMEYLYSFSKKLGYCKSDNISMIEDLSVEETITFYQEIFDGNGNLIEIHEKFPADKGHRKL